AAEGGQDGVLDVGLFAHGDCGKTHIDQHSFSFLGQAWPVPECCYCKPWAWASSVELATAWEKLGFSPQRIQWVLGLRRNQVSCRLAYCRERSFTSSAPSSTGRPCCKAATISL